MEGRTTSGGLLLTRRTPSLLSRCGPMTRRRLGIRHSSHPGGDDSSCGWGLVAEAALGAAMGAAGGALGAIVGAGAGSGASVGLRGAMGQAARGLAPQSAKAFRSFAPGNLSPFLKSSGQNRRRELWCPKSVSVVELDPLARMASASGGSVVWRFDRITVTSRRWSCGVRPSLRMTGVALLRFVKRATRMAQVIVPMGVLPEGSGYSLSCLPSMWNSPSVSSPCSWLSSTWHGRDTWSASLLFVRGVVAERPQGAGFVIRELHSEFG